MFTFSWVELVTDELLDRILEPLSNEMQPSRDQLRQALVPIFHNVGGLPVIETALSETEKTMLGEKMLVDALRHYLKFADLLTTMPGYYLANSSVSMLDNLIACMDVVDINRADQQDIESLPNIGVAKAREILRERRENGYFSSLEELITRINGLGSNASRSLRYVTRFDIPVGEPSRVENTESQLGDSLYQALMGLDSIAPQERLLYLLDLILSLTAKSPHPNTTQQIPRSYSALNLEPQYQAECLGILNGTAYYERLPEFFRTASTSIKIAMFHMAFPGPNHPTKLLLDELIVAKARGVHVQVVLDRDRVTDPYMSTVINTNAKRYLENNGIECQWDKEDVLLHSKYVLIDNKLSILGSHNWSAGSYSQFDDMSFVVQSLQLGAALNIRFEQLWNNE